MLQAISGRSGGQQQEQNSPNLSEAFQPSPVHQRVICFVYIQSPKSLHGEGNLTTSHCKFYFSVVSSLESRVVLNLVFTGNMNHALVKVLWILGAAGASVVAATNIDHDDLVNEAHERVRLLHKWAVVTHQPGPRR